MVNLLFHFCITPLKLNVTYSNGSGEILAEISFNPNNLYAEHSDDDILTKQWTNFSNNGVSVYTFYGVMDKKGFAYLSLITDAYSRKIVGFYLSKTLESIGSIRALKMALQNNPNSSNLIHHSDRGVQYCCNAYVGILKNRKIKISMTENGDTLENAIAERVNGILKDELLEEKYKDFTSAQQAVAKAISVYNHLRPHSSISYKTPIELHTNNEPVERKWKNYYARKGSQNVEVAAELYR